MAKRAAPAKKAPAKAAAKAPAKAPARKAVSKGDVMECSVCGMEVVVEEVGGMTFQTGNALLCCGKPMAGKAKKAAAAKK